MTIETVQYISDLDPTNPKGSDRVAEGDNHIRNIKRAIKDTFPNLDGPVTVTQDELNNLDGLVESVQPALPEAPTIEGSMLANSGTKWRENATIKLIGDKAYIPALAGLGNINLYVNNEGEIVASEQSTDPTFIHGLDVHPDVDFTNAPSIDDVLVFDGTKWVAKKTGGNMINPIAQTSVCGDFSYGAVIPGGWGCAGDAYRTFSVPAGQKFILTGIYTYGVINLRSMTIDGKTPFPFNAGYDTGSNGTFNPAGNGGVCWQAKNNITMLAPTNGLTFYGVLVEDK